MKGGLVITMMEEARINVTDDGGAVTITGGGSLSFLNSSELGQGLKQASLNADSLTVDLRAADFIDTQVVQDLGKAAVVLLDRGKRLRVLMAETAYPLRVLQISGYERIMDVEVESEGQPL